MDAALKCPRCGCGLSAERARLGPGIALENALERIESLPFTAKQREIARLMVEGYSNREIAERLKNTEQVIKNWTAKMYDVSGTNNRAELISLLAFGQIRGAIERRRPIRK